MHLASCRQEVEVLWKSRIFYGCRKIGKLLGRIDISHSSKVEGKLVIKSFTDQERFSYPPSPVNRYKSRITICFNAEGKVSSLSLPINCCIPGNLAVSQKIVSFQPN
jgi:hypothetical protein